MTTDYPEQVLNQYLQRMLSDVDAETIALLRCHLQWVEAAAGDAALQQPGLARSAATDTAASRRIVSHLDELELTHDFVLLVGDADASAWTQRCSRHSDERLLLADASQPPVLHETETACLMQRGGENDAAQILVLMHDAGVQCPSGTRQWLARRPVADHVHVRPTLNRDMARLARIHSRTAVGLVLAGGGAKGWRTWGCTRRCMNAALWLTLLAAPALAPSWRPRLRRTSRWTT